MWFGPQEHPSERRVALTISALYFGFGVVWEFLSEIFVHHASGDPHTLARVETLNGWLFVALSAAAIYVLSLDGGLRLTRAQKALRAIIDSIGDVVLLINKDRRIAHANPATARFLGADSAESLVGMDAEEVSRRFHFCYPDGSVIPPEELAAVKALQGGPPQRYRARLYPAPEHELTVSVTATGIRATDDPHPRGVVSVFHDVTEHDQLERLRERVFALAAHELKTPVAIISAHVELLMQGLETDRRHGLATIDRQCSRIDLIVQNLLIMARIRTSSLTLYPNLDDLAALLEPILEEAQTTRPHPALDVYIGASPRVRLDAERFSLAMRNILDYVRSVSKPEVPIQLALRQKDGNATIEVRVHRTHLPRRHELISPDHDERDVHQVVTDTIIRAHGGSVSRELHGLEQTVTVSLPTVEVAIHDQR